MRLNRRMGLVVLSLLVVSAAQAQGGLQFYRDQILFRSSAAGAGKILKGTEGFEAGNIGVGQVTGMDDPLDTNTNNGFFHPGDIQWNLRLQSNMGGMNSAQLNPAGVNGLALLGANFFNNGSKTVVANNFVDALDIIFLSPKTAIGGFVQTYFNADSVRMDVYGPGNVLLGTDITPGNNGGIFWGVVSNVPITRINLYSLTNQAEGMDDIEMWEAVPEPASMIALGLGAAALMRRRRARG